ncbi:MAG TPA: hypothetical protein VEW46_16385 [Pyrinomonadaceae bacterium]|nr:hypothetical protein [Pyrinomonadaceae bacterium]
MNIPGFTAEASLYHGSEDYQAATSSANDQQVVPQSRQTCAFKAGRLAGRCLSLGHDHGDCMAAAADFNQFCNDYDL